MRLGRLAETMCAECLAKSRNATTVFLQGWDDTFLCFRHFPLKMTARKESWVLSPYGVLGTGTSSVHSPLPSLRWFTPGALTVWPRVWEGKATSLRTWAVICSPLLFPHKCTVESPEATWHVRSQQTDRGAETAIQLPSVTPNGTEICRMSNSAALLTGVFGKIHLCFHNLFILTCNVTLRYLYYNYHMHAFMWTRGVLIFNYLLSQYFKSFLSSNWFLNVVFLLNWLTKAE